MTGLDDATWHYIGIDGGLMAGVAVLTVATPKGGSRVATLSSSEMPWRDAVSYTERWCRKPEAPFVRVGAERYTIPTGRSVVTAQLDAIMCNGALDWLTTQRDVTFALQPRAEVKKMTTDAVLKRKGWFVKTKDGHANDAARHASFMLFQHQPSVWLDLFG